MRPQRIAKPIFVAALVLVLIYGASAFVAFVSGTGASLEKRALLSVASAAAAALDTGEVAKLKGPGQNVNDSSFRIVRQEMQRVRDAIGGVRFVYLVGERNGQVIFLADAENQLSSDYSPPGQIYFEAPQSFRHVLTTGDATIVGPYTDRWGNWTSALAPVVDPQTKRVLAVIGVDVPATAWRQEVTRYRLFATAIIGLAGAVIALFGVIVFVQSRARSRIGDLNADLKTQVNELTLANRIVENSSTVVFRLDLGEPMKLGYISQNVERFGYRAADLLRAVPLDWRKYFHEDDRAGVESDIERLKSGLAEKSRREVRFLKSDGSWAWLDGRLSVVYDQMRRRVALEGIMFDISDMKRAEEQIAHLATHDALTGLVNRPAFLERLQMAAAEAKRNNISFAVLYIDVDHFKDINDALGHEKGDFLLKEIGGRLARTLRETDSVGRFSVARFGGDEFAVLESAVKDADDAAALAQRLIKTLAEPFSVNGNEVHVTVSIGISIYDASTSEPNDLLMQADLALYRAKESGRNQFHFHSGNLDTDVRERVAIGEDLYAAIENDELELHYQPQVEIPSGRIVGMEALIRWHHPKRGLIWPDVFIPVAEKSSIIGALGKWTINRACRQIEIWREEGLSPPLVGINVSAAQFRDPAEFIGIVQAALKQHAVEPWKLELELTESVLVETTARHDDILDKLRALGLRIAIDDFGTGYSSLQYLHSYPISRIKIAQQFVRDVTGGTGDAAIVRAVIELAHALNLALIAEGVETSAQAAFLGQAGCNTIQGYYFSPPVPAETMGDLLRAGKFAYPPNEKKRVSAA